MASFLLGGARKLSMASGPLSHRGAIARFPSAFCLPVPVARTFATAAAALPQASATPTLPAPTVAPSSAARSSRHVRLLDVPAGLQIAISEPESLAGVQNVSITGPQGTALHRVDCKGLRVELVDGKMRLTRFLKDAPITTHQTVLGNLLWGALTPYRRTLSLKGVGFGVRKVEEKEGHGKGAVELKVGYRKPIIFEPPEGVKLTAITKTDVLVEGMDKQKVGQTAFRIRKICPPNRYTGKGVRYSTEKVKLKESKKKSGGGK